MKTFMPDRFNPLWYDFLTKVILFNAGAILLSIILIGRNEYFVLMLANLALLLPYLLGKKQVIKIDLSDELMSVLYTKYLFFYKTRNIVIKDLSYNYEKRYIRQRGAIRRMLLLVENKKVIFSISPKVDGWTEEQIEELHQLLKNFGVESKKIISVPFSKNS